MAIFHHITSVVLLVTLGLTIGTYAFFSRAWWRSPSGRMLMLSLVLLFGIVSSRLLIVVFALSVYGWVLLLINSFLKLGASFVLIAVSVLIIKAQEKGYRESRKDVKEPPRNT